MADFKTDETTLLNIKRSFARYAEELTPRTWADLDYTLRQEFAFLFNGNHGRYMWHVMQDDANNSAWFVTLYDHYPQALSAYPHLDEVAKTLDNQGHHVMIIRRPLDRRTNKVEELYLLRMDVLFYFHEAYSNLREETLPYFLTVFKELYGVSK